LLTVLVGAAVSSSSCTGCVEPNKPVGKPTCVLDNDCGTDAVCRSGSCVHSLLSDAGVVDEPDAGPVDAGPASVGILSVLPGNTVDFGAVRVGVPVQRSITLQNTGPVALTVLQIVVDDNTSATFASDPVGTVNQELAPGATMGIALTHTPNDGIPDHASLKIVHTGDGQLAVVDLVAEFKGISTLSLTTTVGATTPNATTIDFGDVPVGSSLAQKVFARNIGANDSVLSLSAAALTPGNAGFAVMTPPLSPALVLSSYEGTCPNGIVDCALAAAACTDGACVDASGVPLDSAALALSFAPTAVGPTTATLTLTSDAGGVVTTTDVVLTGNGVQGVLQASPASVLFADAFTNRTNVQTVHLSNAGSAPVTLTSIDVGGAFTVDQPATLPHEFAPGEGLDMHVNFNPPFAGQFTRTLVLHTNTQNTSIDVVGNARDAPQIHVIDTGTLTDIPAPGVQFGDVYLATNKASTVALVNEGPSGSTLHVSRLIVDGPAANRFSINPSTITQALPAAIGLQPRLEITVNYLPGALTGVNDTATLRIDSDDPDVPEIAIPLVGRAVQPIAVVSPTTIDFGPVLVGATPPTRTITITNNGFGNLIVTNITAPDRSELVRVVNGSLPAVVPGAGQGSLTVTVRFTPTTNTNITSSLVVSTNDVANPAVTVTLGGGGASCTPRANASVQVINSQCVFTCNGGFHACGDACLSNTSPDSCGNSCTPCAGRNNAARGCTAATSTCTYACNSTFKDLDNDLGVAQGNGSDGCEYQCPVNPPVGERCNGLDDNCNGVADEGLASDGFDGNVHANDSCGSPTRLDTAQEGGTTTITASLYPFPAVGGDDIDFYIVNFHEGSHTCFPGTNQLYKATVSLTNIPAGTDYDLTIASGCSLITNSAAGGNSNEFVEVDIDGTCGFDDSEDFVIGVNRFGNAGSCANYTLAASYSRR
jgi:hypothetical protein